MFSRLQQHPAARRGVDAAPLARVMDAFFWSLLARAAIMPDRELQDSLDAATHLIYHGLFEDSARKTPRGRKAALITFDVTADGIRPVPRAHLALIAGGLAISLESNVSQGATIMSAFAPMSFAGLASSLAVWLLSGGTLVLHHPFDEEVLETQINEHACDTLIAPAPLALRLENSTSLRACQACAT